MIVNKTIGDVPVIWRDVREAPFMLHGLLLPNESEPYYHRIPESVTMPLGADLCRKGKLSAGGRVRFTTDSPYIAIRVKFVELGRTNVMPLIGSAGFDLFIDGEFGSRYVKEFRLPMDSSDGYEQITELDGAISRSYTVNFPIGSIVERVEIGLKPEASVSAPRPYRDIAPITIYGSSIVHGYSSTHPGYAYPAIISRELNVDIRNFGFGGVAKGEIPMAEWLAGLETSVFVCDYDHNVPNPEYLKATHYPFYLEYRKKNPTTPYIMITRPNYYTCQQDRKQILRRRDVVMESYLRARAEGDENVYFIDGLSFCYAPHQYDFSVDGVHPNDPGFIRMADAIGTVIRHALELSE